MTNEEKAQLKAKNKKVKDGVKKHAPDGGPFTLAVAGQGQVAFESLDTAEDQEGAEFLEVYLAHNVGGDPHYRIYNPPINARMPDGSLREDPVMAVAQLLAKHGGKQKR